MPPHSAPTRPTHFLCIPLVTSTSRAELEASISSFSARIASPTPGNPTGIPRQAVRPPGTIHLTLGVMSLLTRDRIDAALSLLQNLNLTALLAGSQPAAISVVRGSGISVGRQNKDGPRNEPEASPGEPKLAELQVTLRGLVSMREPSQTSILYAPPIDENGALYAFCRRLRSIFLDAGFLTPDTRPLLLHATIINTIYLSGKRSKMAIDARDLLQTFRDWTWMKNARLEKVAICRMGARSVTDAHGRETGDEAYVVEGEIRMP